MSLVVLFEFWSRPHEPHAHKCCTVSLCFSGSIISLSLSRVSAQPWLFSFGGSLGNENKIRRTNAPQCAGGRVCRCLRPCVKLGFPLLPSAETLVHVFLKLPACSLHPAPQPSPQQGCAEGSFPGSWGDWRSGLARQMPENGKEIASIKFLMPYQSCQRFHVPLLLFSSHVSPQRRHGHVVIFFVPQPTSPLVQSGKRTDTCKHTHTYRKKRVTSL